MIENLAMHRKTSDPMLKITNPCLKVSSHYFNYYHCLYFHPMTLSHTIGLLDTLEFIRLALAAPWNSSNDLEFSVITYNVLSNKNHANSLLTRLKNFQSIFFLISAPMGQQTILFLPQFLHVYSSWTWIKPGSAFITNLFQVNLRSGN